jgi:hypothetical protein
MAEENMRLMWMGGVLAVLSCVLSLPGLAQDKTTATREHSAALALEQRPDLAVAIPVSIDEWVVEGEPSMYNRKTVFDYLDGGAEIYLAYGMKSVLAVRYARVGEPSIDLSVFEMEGSEGALGAFSYERLDPEAGIGQGSEYAAGMLRFWRGHFFVFIQAERETPNSRGAVLNLGKLLASRVGPDDKLPPLLGALPREGLRPFTVRYTISPLILKNIEPTLSENPLGLPEHAPTVVGRYWKPGNPERILIARLPDEASSRSSVESYRKTRIVQSGNPSIPFRSQGGWSLVAAEGIHAVLILDAPDAVRALGQFEEIKLKLKEIAHDK